MTPDPAGMAAADPANPQSWNRYAYVMNNPLNATDPFGLCYFGDGATIGAGQPRDPGLECGTSALDSSNPGDPQTETGYMLAKPNLHDQSKLIRAIQAMLNDEWVFQMLVNRTWRPHSTTPNIPSNKNCQAGPLNLSQNIQTAKELAGQFWSGLLNASSVGGATQAGGAAGTYVGLVQTGGAWDPKNGPGGPSKVNIAAGNINFGATCLQFGFNTWLGGQVCQYGAGIYGKLSGVYGSYLFSRYHGDIPSDNQQIRQGLALAKKGGC